MTRSFAGIGCWGPKNSDWSDWRRWRASGGGPYGAEQQETGVQKAERIVGEELRRLGRREDVLPGRPRGHSGKVMMARRLRQETAMSLKWIAQRLPMGTWNQVVPLRRATGRPLPSDISFAFPGLPQFS